MWLVILYKNTLRDESGVTLIVENKEKIARTVEVFCEEYGFQFPHYDIVEIKKTKSGISYSDYN